MNAELRKSWKPHLNRKPHMSRQTRMNRNEFAQAARVARLPLTHRRSCWFSLFTRLRKWMRFPPFPQFTRVRTVGVLVLAACHPHVAPDATPAPTRASLAQVYYWRAKPGMLAAYNAYIHHVALPIDEDARRHGAFISVTTYQSRDSLSPWTHMRIFLVRDSAQLASLAAELNAAGARIEPDSTKRRARSDYATTLRDAAGNAVLDIIR
jgi:hypothetical protein